MASLVAFIEGHEQRRLDWVALSGILMGLKFLTKYTGILVIPLALLWHWWNRKAYCWQATVLALAIFAVVFLVWGWWGIETYGQMHFFATLPRGFHATSWQGLLVLVLVLSGLAWRDRIRGDRPTLAALSWILGSP